MYSFKSKLIVELKLKLKNRKESDFNLYSIGSQSVTAHSHTEWVSVSQSLRPVESVN